MTSVHDTHPRGRRPLSGDELADMEEQFGACDQDGDGRIDFTEFSRLLEDVGSELGTQQRRAEFESIDSDRDGAIGRNEFMNWWRGP